LGYGFGAFWGGSDQPGATVWALLPSWDPKPLTAHNGFLELALDLGLVGEMLFVGSLVVNVMLAIGLARRDRTMLGVLAPIFFAFLLLTSLPEGPLVMQNTFLWIVYVVISVHLSAGVPSSRRSAPADGAPVGLGHRLPRQCGEHS
jgi:O-antigen ligase